MNDPEQVKKTANLPALAAGSLLVMAGLLTVVVFMMIVGRFPPMEVLWLPLVEIALGVFLMFVRNRIVVWIVLLGIVGTIGLHGYRLKKLSDMAQLRASLGSQQAHSDPDSDTRATVSRMDQIQNIRITVNWMVIGLQVFALGFVFGTRRGRELLYD